MLNTHRQFIRSYSGFFFGFLLFIIVLFFIPSDVIPVYAQRMSAITVLMAVWWITEAIPIAVTALLPIVLYPLLGIMKTSNVTTNYGHHLVFLFLGGFIIALTIEKWNLHKRIALYIIKWIGINPRMIIFGFMLATAFLSMWISNTATAMMMIPIGLAVISQISPKSTEGSFEHGKSNFALALMLAIAYAASIGGISTLIGTPPNLVFIGMLKANFPAAPEISFIQWMLFAFPFSVVFLPITWFYLVFIAAPVRLVKTEDQHERISKELEKLGSISRPEKYTLVIFALTAFLWMFRADVDLGFFQFRGWASRLGLSSYVHDSTVAIAMAVLTFIVPAGPSKSGRTEFLMDWTSTTRIPWGILLLFGGGFALASGFQESGLTRWLGEQLSTFHFMPLILIIMLICLLTTFTTEFASNTAMASTLLPIIAGLAVAININPILLMIPVTISSSTAFMLPVATPPNAIVFGSGYIRIRDMVRVGVVLNFVGLILITIFVYLLAGTVFQIDWNVLPTWAK
jgi:sodium-dependent dicarboxylate transporter 2/3/5